MAEEENEGAAPRWSCPISQCPVEDPVVASDGYTYEREFLERYCREAEDGIPLSPVTRDPLRPVAYANPLASSTSSSSSSSLVLYTGVREDVVVTRSVDGLSSMRWYEDIADDEGIVRFAFATKLDCSLMGPPPLSQLGDATCLAVRDFGLHTLFRECEPGIAAAAWLPDQGRSFETACLEALHRQPKVRDE